MYGGRNLGQERARLQATAKEPRVMSSAQLLLTKAFRQYTEKHQLAWACVY